MTGMFLAMSALFLLAAVVIAVVALWALLRALGHGQDQLDTVIEAWHDDRQALLRALMADDARDYAAIGAQEGALEVTEARARHMERMLRGDDVGPDPETGETPMLAGLSL